MQIKSVTGSPYYPKDLPGNTQSAKSNAQSQPKDKLELSAEAQNIQKSQGLDPKLEEIKEKVNSKFYDSDDVVNTVADKMLKDVKNK